MEQLYERLDAYIDTNEGEKYIVKQFNVPMRNKNYLSKKKTMLLKFEL